MFGNSWYITPCQIYAAEEFLKDLLYQANIHSMNFKTTGHSMRFVTSPICEKMIANYSWLEDKTIPYWFRVPGLKGWVSHTAEAMGTENYIPEQTCGVTWSNHPNTALQPPKPTDAFPLQFCSMNVTIPESDEPKEIELTEFIGRNATMTLNLNAVDFDMLHKEINLFNPETHDLVYYPGGEKEVDNRMDVKMGPQLRPALNILHQFLGPYENKLHFHVEPLPLGKH
jgi:hypothetical protein